MTWPGRSFESMLFLTAVGPEIVGSTTAASIRPSVKALLIGGPGAAATGSAVASGVAAALPTKSMLNFGIFFVSAVPSALLGTLLAFAFSGNPRRDERP